MCLAEPLYIHCSPRLRIDPIIRDKIVDVLIAIGRWSESGGGSEVWYSVPELRGSARPSVRVGGIYGHDVARND